MKKLMSLSVVCAAFFFASCGSNSNQNNATEANSDNATEATTPQDESSMDNSQMATSNTINLTGNDQMQYNDTAFTVKAGKEITLTMKNIGKLPAAAMSHDVVVLKPGSDVLAFGKASTIAKDVDNVSDDLKKEIITKTKMLASGEEDTITFTLDKPGKYPFVCTFPGHYMSMNGIITVE